MKKITILLLILCNISYSQIEKSALFIGNSYTNSNNLPGIVSDIATADGNILTQDKVTPGGYTFEGHSMNATTLSKISESEWDFVVLQEQSQLPSFPWEQVHDECFPFAEILVDSIRSANPCAIPLFFNTWGRRDGEAMWDSINTFIKMNNRLHIAYDYMADTHSGQLSPIGIGYRDIYSRLDPTVTFTDLYVGDGSHPSIYGSYLSACFFYEIIFETPIDGNTFIPAGMTAEETSFLQEVATHVLHEVDSITIDYTIPIASYTVSHDGAIATFTNTSAHAFEYFWEFGDGETSTEEHPVHEYPDAGEYIATLTAINCEQEDVSIGGIDDSGLNDIEKNPFKIYPNPTNESVFIAFNTPNTIVEIYTIDGVLYSSLKGDQIIETTLPSGIYIVRIGNATQRLTVL